MAGYSCVFAVGSGGGFMGNDGVNPDVLLMVGEGDCRWVSPIYTGINLRKKKKMIFDENVKAHIPDGPDDRNMLIDAMILFCADYFRECPSFDEVKRLWFEGKISMFKSKMWAKLRREALRAIKDQDIMICIGPFVDVKNAAKPPLSGGEIFSQ